MYLSEIAFTISLISLLLTLLNLYVSRLRERELENLETRIYGDPSFNSFYILPKREEIEKAEECKKILNEYKKVIENKEV